MPLYLVQGPQVPIVSLEDAKAHLRVDHDDEDELIEAFVAAATARLDGRDGLLQRALVEQTWDLKLEQFPYFDCWEWSWRNRDGAWPTGGISLPLPPLISVDSVKYIDTNGVEQTFSSGGYRVGGIGGGQRSYIQLRDTYSWPTLASNWPEPVVVRFTAGYVDTSDSPPSVAVPQPIVMAIKLIVGHLYANRESVVIGQTAVEVPQSAQWLLEPFKVYA